MKTLIITLFITIGIISLCLLYKEYKKIHNKLNDIKNKVYNASNNNELEVLEVSLRLYFPLNSNKYCKNQVDKILTLIQKLKKISDK